MESEVNIWSKYVSKKTNVRNAYYVVKCMNRKFRRPNCPLMVVKRTTTPQKGKGLALIPDTQQSGLMNQIAFLSAGVLQFIVDITYSVCVPEDGRWNEWSCMNNNWDQDDSGFWTTYKHISQTGIPLVAAYLTGCDGRTHWVFFINLLLMDRFSLRLALCRLSFKKSHFAGVLFTCG